MAGLLDFLNTPAGMGLLSAVAGGMATARRGTPFNNIGRGAVAGITGYNYAINQKQQDAQDALNNKYRQMQMDQMTQQLANQKALKQAALGAYQDASTPQYAAGNQSFDTPEKAQLSANATYSLPSGAVPDSIMKPAPLVGYDQQDPAPTLQDFSLGQTPQVTAKAPTDMRSAMYSRLMQAGFPEEAAKYAPKWIVGERYNTKTGMPEKVLYDENNPTNAQPFGGTQADTVVADNLGGQMVYRGSHSAQPMGTVQRTVSPDSILTAQTAIRGQDIGNANAAASRAVTLRGQNLTDARAAAGQKPLTEVQGKAALFGARAAEADKVLTEMEGKYSRVGLAAKQGAEGTWGVGGMLGAAGNAMLSDNAQKVQQAQNDFVNAVLRQESGAAISQSEFDNARKQYFPVPGDSPAVVVQKARNRRTAILGFKNIAGRGAYDAPQIDGTLPGGWTVQEH